jgi:hypothetical protein
MINDVHSSLLWFPDCFNNHSGRLQSHAAQGKQVPEGLLPGRVLMAMTPEHRAELANADWLNVADWYIKQIL